MLARLNLASQSGRTQDIKTEPNIMILKMNPRETPQDYDHHGVQFSDERRLSIEQMPLVVGGT